MARTTLIYGARYWLLKLAWSYVNLPYRWGGDDPMTGFDCSGMVVELLKAVGALPLHADLGADMLWRMYIPARPEAGEAAAGHLAFWFNDKGEATHVAVCVDGEFCLTANGGGRATKELADAVRMNAFVTLRRLDHRSDQPRFVRLFDQHGDLI